MLVVDVLYVALATIAVMVVLQLITFVGARMMYPPEPKIIYREVQVPVPAPPAPPPSAPVPPPPAFTQPQNQQQVELPEYEPRKPTSTSLRMDPELPAGLQETRPPGT